MKIPTILISTFLSWTAIDLNLLRRQRYSTLANGGAEISISYAEEEQQEEKQIQPRANIIPQWLRNFRQPLRMKVNHFNAKTRDPRYSDQKKIRRRINNM